MFIGIHLMLHLMFSSLTAINYSSAIGDHKIDYDEQDRWKDYHAQCGGTQQSPIDLPRLASRPAEPGLLENQLTLLNYDHLIDFIFINDHHTVKMKPVQPTGSSDGEELVHELMVHIDYNNTITNPIPKRNNSLKFGDKKDVERLRLQAEATSYLPTALFRIDTETENSYHLHDIHFHWGVDYAGESGTEHSIDGVKGAMEIHMVHWRDGITIEELEHDKHGLLVIAILVQLYEGEQTEALNRIVLHMSRFEGICCDETKSMRFVPGNLLSPEGKFYKYYWYHGSLTTPPCYETVDWIVMGERLKMSRQQYELFRSLTKLIPSDIYRDQAFIGPNYRKLRDRNDRPIYRNQVSMLCNFVPRDTRDI